MRKTVQITADLKKEYPNIIFSKEIIGLFEQFLEILSQWNKKINLTAIQDPDQMIVKHLYDSLAIYKTSFGSTLLYPFSGSLLDMGSGAGIPGILLLISNPLLHLISVDKSGKKIGFQEFIRAKLKLTNLHPIFGRLESMMKCEDYVASQDCIVSRAFDQIKDLFEYGHIFLKQNGHLILWKGKEWKNELNCVPEVLRSQFQLLEICEYQFTRFDMGGTILVFKKK
ncbi:MAG: 16S rRNA (guanine(527)-N(7))-methyltransferase RsmG [SAR324 cluster bacterium]|nr:16S rRNA (guanine(527)-N(7))-methyltransferase RsmG [SAR324 cluster bacterium]